MPRQMLSLAAVMDDAHGKFRMPFEPVTKGLARCLDETVMYDAERGARCLFKAQLGDRWALLLLAWRIVAALAIFSLVLAQLLAAICRFLIISECLGNL